jgi:hypothetical protein
MKLEFELNVMGIVYILIAVALVAGAITAFVTTTKFLIEYRDPFSGFISVLILSSGLVAVGLLVPVVRRIFKAFMPSA